MARRKPAPRFPFGTYTKQAAFSGGRVETVTIVDVRQVVYSTETEKGNYADWLYTLERPGSGAFGGSRILAYECELWHLNTRLVDVIGRAA